jgi:transcriptional regulator with XRE-family HTH domain
VPQKKGLTQEQLAHAADVSYEHVNHIENYRRMASLEVIARLSSALGYCRASEFLARDRSGVL